MVPSHNDSHTASSVSQDNPGRARGLGRGSSPKNRLQSPKNSRNSTWRLRIIQCNINGLGIPATRLKLNQILDLADMHQVEVIALQETKLGEIKRFKVKGYNVIRKHRAAGGGGLMFPVKNVYFKNNPDPAPWNTRA
ncbi:hypothetical protein HNY73_006432 [Argiope bruennichi]|uniref:Endonuclease/exonuclease/phosphatase domain-containing protein n=1 Tax=Argiope bruennichi TaxID=94029 RepID=A0A8T0FQ50_ARGBR|nr:hypothetical protein HNY73_006432 [Argiope bruennichi]